MTEFIKWSVGLVAVLLAGCSQQDQCVKDAAAVDAKWADRKPTSKADVRAEIDALLPDNKCGSITPWRIRKVMNDLASLHQCTNPQMLAKIASYQHIHDAKLVRDIAIEIAECGND